MLGQWRIFLRQAEEAARAGRFDEALALASKPEVVDHHHAVQLRSRLALDLLARAGRRGEADDLAGAVEDLALAERLGAAPDSLASARLKLADHLAGEVRGDLDAGEPARVVERIDGLARHKIGGPSLRRTREIAEAWQNALDEARRGEFGRSHDQLDRAERLAAGGQGGGIPPALAAARRDVEARQKTAAPRVEALYKALEKGEMAGLLNAAEAVLEAVPEHPAARQARTRAWQQIAAIGPSSATLPARGSRLPQSSPGTAPPAAAGADPTGIVFEPARHPHPHHQQPAAAHEPAPIVWINGGGKAAATPRPLVRAVENEPKGRFLLWVDAVGGILSVWTTRSCSAAPGTTARPTCL